MIVLCRVWKGVAGTDTVQLAESLLVVHRVQPELPPALLQEVPVAKHSLPHHVYELRDASLAGRGGGEEGGGRGEGLRHW